MKLSLVVAQGVHSGKMIPITTADFIIGRDPTCQLRPASPAVSKQHCGVATRDGKVYVRDCGSTNGTFVNGEQVTAEREVQSGDRLRVGPLEFDLKLEVGAAAKPAAKAKVAETAVAAATAVVNDRSGNTTIIDAPGSGLDEDPDHAAALLLGLDDGPPGSSAQTVEAMANDPTTVMEMPALGTPAAAKPEEKKEGGKKHGDSSSAAADALSKYMRRPRT